MTEGASRKLARDFREKIRTGQWPAGTQVPTTRQLAASYGVSVNTVQNAFRELEGSDLIERKPRLGGFVKGAPPRRHAQVDWPSRTPVANTIAVVGPYTHEAYHAEADLWWGYRIIRGCESEVVEAKFHIAMFSFDSANPHAMSKILAKVDEAGESVGGVLTFLWPSLAGLTAELDKRNLAWVTVNRPRDHAAQNFVAQDSLRGTRHLAHCLARVGAKRVALLSDKLVVGRSTVDKFHGFMQGWVEAGMPTREVDFVEVGGYEEAVGYERMKRQLAENPSRLPEAIVASGDLLALGAMRACRDAGLTVGRDVRVVGLTGLDLAAYAHPPLTVVQAPMEQMGVEAARMLLDMSREGARRMIGRYVPTRLISRESCVIPDEVASESARAILDDL